MSKELTPLDALKTIILGTNVDTYRSSVEEIDNAISIIEKALKRLKKIETTTHSVLREDISNKLKTLEIIKSFNDYQIVEVQGKWYLMRGIEFGKSIKMPITKEQVDILKEALL